MKIIINGVVLNIKGEKHKCASFSMSISHKNILRAFIKNKAVEEMIDFACKFVKNSLIRSGC